MKHTNPHWTQLAMAAAAAGVLAFATQYAGASWKFAVTDDSRANGGDGWAYNGVSTNVMARIADAVAREPGVELFVFPGDMVTGETMDTNLLRAELALWQSILAPVYQAGIPVVTTRGNHEYDTLANGVMNPQDPSYHPYLDLFPNPLNGSAGETGLTYSFEYKNVLFVGFDQYAGRTAAFNNTFFDGSRNGGQMMNPWVTQQVTSSSQPVVFAFAHEQLFSSVSHPDCMANDPASRDALVDALAARGGAYLCGHDHMYVRANATSDYGLRVPEFVVGTGGGGNYSYAPAGNPGYTGHVTGDTQVFYDASKGTYFGYLVVAVNDDGTWSAEFKGALKNALAADGPFITLDTFRSPTPLAIQEEVLNQLNGWALESFRQPDASILRMAVQRLTDAANPLNWSANGSSLQPACGQQVFDSMRQGTSQLISLSHANRSLASVLQAYACREAAAGRILAAGSILSLSGQARATAQNLLDLGDAAAASGRAVEALGLYKAAWQFGAQ